MDAKDLKKILAGFCVASLITGSAFVVSGCVTDKSTKTGAKPTAGSSKSG